jgi:hypothetical protein
MKIINNWLKQPESYNKEFWQYNDFNINELAFHTHDGEKGDKLPPSSLDQLTAQIQTTVADGSMYKNTVTLPTNVKFDDTTISFFLNGARVYLDYAKVDDDNYDVWSPYNTLTYEARYA